MTNTGKTEQSLKYNPEMPFDLPGQDEDYGSSWENFYGFPPDGSDLHSNSNRSGVSNQKGIHK